ncbi:hypothetical protein EDC04DRAFT_2607352 [Pisolithus marmoratus]|nr:hypothetical protein EDC04DRAFT_2607352 [Pisolithus marmoratus]
MHLHPFLLWGYLPQTSASLCSLQTCWALSTKQERVGTVENKHSLNIFPVLSQSLGKAVCHGKVGNLVTSHFQFTADDEKCKYCHIMDLICSSPCWFLSVPRAETHTNWEDLILLEGDCTMDAKFIRLATSTQQTRLLRILLKFLNELGSGIS